MRCGNLKNGGKINLMSETKTQSKRTNNAGKSQTNSAAKRAVQNLVSGGNKTTGTKQQDTKSRASKANASKSANTAKNTNKQYNYPYQFADISY